MINRKDGIPSAVAYSALLPVFSLKGGSIEMFGYVRFYKPMLRVGEYEQYQGVYCTLCRRLGRRYGPLSQGTISYDMAFFALLHMAVNGESPAFCRSRCVYNPAKRCLRCRHTEAADLAADISVLLNYYKLRDTLRDERGFRKMLAMLLYPPVAWSHRRAARRRPAEDQRIAAMIEAQSAVEQAKIPSVDAAAEPFALLLRDLFVAFSSDSTQQRILDRFGYCLGRWIYLIDAVDDLPSDYKKGNYNPYILCNNIQREDDIPAIRQQCEGGLNACLAECIAAFDLLTVSRFRGILDNILRLGMPRIQTVVISGEKITDKKRMRIGETYEP